MLNFLTDPKFLALAPATVVPLAAIIGFFWRKIRRDELEASLKSDMLQRGMSADDIVKVLQGSGADADNCRRGGRRREERIQRDL